MKQSIWTVAVVAMTLATGAQADAILGEIAAVQPKAPSATPGNSLASMDKAAQKAAKRAAKAEKRAAKRLASQCRKEQKRFEKKGIALSSACAHGPATIVDVEATENASGAGSPMGNALGQTGASNQQGTQGNGNAYGLGQGGGANSNPNNNVVTPSLPPAAFQPVSGPTTAGTPSLTSEVVEVPEPTTVALMGLGLLGLGAVGRRQRG